MYIRFGGEKPHLAVLVGCFENSDGQTYAIYNNRDNEQTIVPYDDFINEVYKEDDGYLQTI